MNNEQIVNSIKTLCQEHNITITKLEETLGMSQGLISRWNKSDPSLNKIIDIAEYFKISLDETVGYPHVANDEFLNKLILQTTNGQLTWHKYISHEDNPKKFTNNYAEDIYIKGDSAYTKILSGEETSFYTCIKNGYISLYSYHEFQNSKKNAVICLFIQADKDSNLIEQCYTTKQLIPLWLKVLYSLKEDAPDDIKAEELKNSFLSDIDTSSSPKNFKNADLSGADFSGADLSKSNLSNANLKYANLSGVNLEGAILSNILIDKIHIET